MKKVIEEFFNINYNVMRIINRGLVFSFAIGITGIALLLTYNTNTVTYDIFKGGLILVKASTIFAAEFIGCGFIIDKIKKGII